MVKYDKEYTLYSKYNWNIAVALYTTQMNKNQDLKKKKNITDILYRMS